MKAESVQLLQMFTVLSYRFNTIEEFEEFATFKRIESVKEVRDGLEIDAISQQSPTPPEQHGSPFRLLHNQSIPMQLQSKDQPGHS